MIQFLDFIERCATNRQFRALRTNVRIMKCSIIDDNTELIWGFFSISVEYGYNSSMIIPQNQQLYTGIRLKSNNDYTTD